MMANIETVCPFFSSCPKTKDGKKKMWTEKKIHFHFKKMDFVSNYLLVCTLHVINGACGAQDGDDEKVSFPLSRGFPSSAKGEGKKSNYDVAWI